MSLSRVLAVACFLFVVLHPGAEKLAAILIVGIELLAWWLSACFAWRPCRRKARNDRRR